MGTIARNVASRCRSARSLLRPQGNESFSGGILAAAKNLPPAHLLNCCHKYKKNSVAVIRTGARKGKLIYFGRVERAAPVTGVGIKEGRRSPSWRGEL